METCASTPLRTITGLPDHQSTKDYNQEEVDMELSAVEPEVVIITEELRKKIETPTSKFNSDTKNFKTKKVKVKGNRGEKRKFSERLDPSKIIKRKKKEEKSVINLIKEQTDEERKIEISRITSGPQPVVLLRNEEIVLVDNDSDVENKETQVKEKPKQMSSRKSKAVVNACNETLNTLAKLGVDMLGAMDKSLKVLKNHNFLNNKLVPVDTLMELVTLALEVNNPDFTDSQKENALSTIVSKLMVEMCNVTKTPRGKQSCIQGFDSPSVKPVDQGEVSVVKTPTAETNDKDIELLNETEKLEQSDTTLELQDISQSKEPKIEKSGKNFCITYFFKKLKKTVEERDKNERFSLFMTKTDMYIAPKLGGELTGERREKFEEEFNNQTCEVKHLFQHSPKYSGTENHKNIKITTEVMTKTNEEKIKEKACEETTKEVDKENTIASDISMTEIEETGKKNEQETSNAPVRKKVSLIRVDRPKDVPVVSRTKAKLLQFHENRRPPYWGTWRRKSENVRARRPFGKDKLLNYEIDSDDEWEEEEEPGESLHGSDDEKEPEEDYEVDNDFFVPHGYLSDDENPEKDTISPKTKLDLLEEQFTSERKQKTRKMTPIVFGTYWPNESTPSKGSLYQDLEIESLKAVPWTSIPIQIAEEDVKKTEGGSEATEPSSQTKKPRQKRFPDEEIPNLIKMIHGSPQNGEILARKFLSYWDEEKVQDGKRPGLTKVCVLKKIKELATWQPTQDKGKRWLVPEETRKEFGADAEAESLTKKPKKCFIWKFVKKVDKTTGVPVPSAKFEPEVMILDS